MDDKHPHKKFYLILILGLLASIGPFSIDMYLPAFPRIADEFRNRTARGERVSCVPR